MIKFLITLILFTSSFSFASENNSISGKINNHTQDKLIIRGEKYNIEIDLNKNGEFKKNFDLKYTGVYNLCFNDKQFKIYLTNGSKIILKADEKNFDNSLIFGGDNAIENNYLKKKEDVFNKVIAPEEKLYSLNENDFLEKVTLWKSEIDKLYNSTKFQNSYFKEHEIKNIDYTESYFFNIFSLFHRTDDGKSTLSENFPKNKMEFNFDFNNVEDYLFSEIYLTMIDSEYYNHIQRLIKNNPNSEFKIKFGEVKKLKNEYLKDKIIKSLIGKIKPQNPDLDYLYNELLKLINDDNLSKEITEKYNAVKKLVKGSPSPTFNYENYNGGSTSLESLKGKYVYIDVWATWCGPCVAQIPSLEKLQKDFEDKNIAFVSISVDKKTDIIKWKKMIEEKKLGGIQLITDDERNSDFFKKYVVSTIPRFILLDKEGKIINADAPRPSDPKLIENLKELGL
ncbi:Thiol-disulfide isomerase or thioredoxin [Flavobacterium swingsii]|uniref:Thiol-disulfide isomerase or thioredoxin n=1 Tax=Flavobacterium swingsii TaxID=498292 RepID=A0A1I0ZU23_9FLAO|nr:TlpA disulfide reductase family protein [Flavobacterium swingsii]SFB27723.1 Thiol-disulfide isomerase or thioredoxin [Flavobacterium swingsii]